MHHEPLKEVAMRREIELLWVAAEGEKQRSAALQDALTDAQYALKRLDGDCRALAADRDELAGALRNAHAELESRTAHFRCIVDDVHRSAAAEQQRRDASFEQRSEALAKREAAMDRREQMLTQVAQQCAAWREAVEDSCLELRDKVVYEANALVRDARAHASRWMGSLRDAHAAVERALVGHMGDWVRDVVGAAQDALQAHRAAMAAAVASAASAPKAMAVDHLPFLLADRIVGLASGHADMIQRHGECLLGAFAEVAKAVVVDVRRQMTVATIHDPTPSASLAAPGISLSAVEEERDRLLADIAELQDNVAGAERRLLSRDTLLATLKRRAESAEDQLSLMQESQATLQRAVRDRDAQLEAARLRFEEQQELVQSFKVLTTKQSRSSEDESLRMEDVGRRQATTFLKDQLSQQLELLHRIEVSEQHAANARAATLVAAVMEGLYGEHLVGCLAEHAEWLHWVSDRMDEERLTLHGTLIEAEEQVATMERQQARLEALLSGTYSASSGLHDVNQPFQLASVQHLVDAAMTAHPHYVAGIYTTPNGGPASTLLASRWTPQQKQHAEHLAAAVGALFLEVKLEFNNLQVHAHRSLLRLFWALAPKERASAHVRVHILEGALAVSESQRLQALTVAQWLEAQCLGAKDALADMLHTTAFDCLPLDEQLGLHVDSSGSGVLHYMQHQPLVSSRRSRSPLPLGAEDDALYALRESHVLSERKATDDARVAHDVCDRLVDTLVALQRRLLIAEQHAQHSSGHMSVRNAEAEELRAHVDRIALTQAVEQEIADDTIGTLRNMLATERQQSLSSLASLLEGCGERNVALRERDAAYGHQGTTLRAVLLLAQYLQHAYEASEEARSTMLCQCALITRVASLRTFKEAEYLLLTVHWELGAALEEAAIDARRSLRTSLGWLKQVHDDNHHLRCEVTRAAQALTDLLEERSVERAAQGMLLTFAQSSFGDMLRNIHDALVGQVLELRNVAWEYIERYVASSREGTTLRQTVCALQDALDAANLQLDEHRVALASSSEAVVTVDAILTEKLRALRERELELRSLTARQEEHDGLIRSLREQLVVYHRLLQDASDERQTSSERARQLAVENTEMGQALRTAKEALTDVSSQLDDESAAHRRTIRTITETVSEPRQRP